MNILIHKEFTLRYKWPKKKKTLEKMLSLVNNQGNKN